MTGRLTAAHRIHAASRSPGRSRRRCEVFHSSRFRAIIDSRRRRIIAIPDGQVYAIPLIPATTGLQSRARMTSRSRAITRSSAMVSARLRRSPGVGHHGPVERPTVAHQDWTYRSVCRACVRLGSSVFSYHGSVKQQGGRAGL
jgi:hypothetical protein